MFKCYSSSRGLNRFLEAQKREYETAYQEISEGKKRSHWIWYIYPQIKGLGMSYMDSEYSIKSIQETIEYINNKVLFERLKEMTNLLIKIPHNDIKEVMWYPDDLKLRSCMTLFYVCTGKHIFQNVIDKFYQGERDLKTILILKGMLEKEKNKISEEHFKSLKNNIIYLEREEEAKIKKKKEEEAKIKKEKEEEAKIKKKKEEEAKIKKEKEEEAKIKKEKEKEKEKENEKKNDRDTSVTNNNITEIKINKRKEGEDQKEIKNGEINNDNNHKTNNINNNLDGNGHQSRIDNYFLCSREPQNLSNNMEHINNNNIKLNDDKNKEKNNSYIKKEIKESTKCYY